MIPRSDFHFDAAVPKVATFWTPSTEDLEGDEGFGFFRDTWVIADVTREQARDMLHDEGQLLAVVDASAHDALEFDLMAHAIEASDAEELSEKQRARLADRHLDVTDTYGALDGLELGVAGLVYALSAIGCYPAASCRGHPGEHAWSVYPVVLMACDEPHARTVAAHAAESGCGLDIDPARPELLAVTANSVADMRVLAMSLLGGGDK